MSQAGYPTRLSSEIICDKVYKVAIPLTTKIVAKTLLQDESGGVGRRYVIGSASKLAAAGGVRQSNYDLFPLSIVKTYNLLNVPNIWVLLEYM